MREQELHSFTSQVTDCTLHTSTWATHGAFTFPLRKKHMGKKPHSNVNHNVEGSKALCHGDPGGRREPRPQRRAGFGSPLISVCGTAKQILFLPPRSPRKPRQQVVFGRTRPSCRTASARRPTLQLSTRTRHVQDTHTPGCVREQTLGKRWH